MQQREDTATPAHDLELQSKKLSSRAVAQLRETNSSVMEILVQGPLNDEAVLPQFPNRKIELIAIDWSGVSYVSSAGIVSWLHWLKLVQEQNPSIRFEYNGCTLSMLEAFKHVRELRPRNASLLSLQVPYRVGETEKSILVSIGKDVRGISQRELMALIEHEIHGRTESLSDIDEIEIEITESDLAFLSA